MRCPIRLPIKRSHSGRPKICIWNIPTKNQGCLRLACEINVRRKLQGIRMDARWQRTTLKTIGANPSNDIMIHIYWAYQPIQILSFSIWNCDFTHSQAPARNANTLNRSDWNIFRVTGPLGGESTGHRWITLTKASDAELWCFLAPEQTIEQTLETPVILDAIAPIMTSL